MQMRRGKAYAGIGSRQTPPNIQAQMTVIASFIEHRGYVLYSGGADGADKAFEAGVSDPGMKKIFLPWKKFNNNSSSLHTVSEEAKNLAQEFHPAWDKLSDAAKLLIARNGYQVLGLTLKEPVDMVLCYTMDGKASGGTGQAIRIAQHYKIPVFNMHHKKDVEILLSWVSVGEIFFQREPEIESWKLI